MKSRHVQPHIFATYLCIAIVPAILLFALFFPKTAIFANNLAPDATSGVDLIVSDLSVSPSNPKSGDLLDITVTVKNDGTEDMLDSDRVIVELYLLPDDAGEPNETTPKEIPHLSNPNLRSGEETTFTRTPNDKRFPADPGCYYVWAWVQFDPNNVGEEANADNNKKFVSVGDCVQPTPVVPPPELLDPYDPGDDACNGTKINQLAINGDILTRTIALGDNDWFVFDGIGGGMYTIAVETMNDDAKVSLALANQCLVSKDHSATTVPFAKGSNSLNVTLPTSRTYYLRATYDPESTSAVTQTAYTIKATLKANCSGYGEPNDSITTARSIVPDGTAHTHTYCHNKDVDWIKFQAEAGKVYTLQNDAQITPMVYEQTAQGLVPIRLNEPNQLSSPTDTIFYIHLTPLPSFAALISSNLSQVARAYTFSITQQDFPPDAWEPGNNSREEATPITVDGSVQYHTITADGDVDWITFDAVDGVQYTVEAVDLGSDAHTHLCLCDTSDVACKLGKCASSGVNNYYYGARGTFTLDKYEWAAGKKYMRIDHRDQENSHAGEETRYALSLVTGYCQPDAYEQRELEKDNPSFLALEHTQQRNFCFSRESPEKDSDWIKFDIPSAGTYHIFTEELWTGSDTMLTLYANDKETVLAENDDFGDGVASRISYSFSSAGTYYAKIEQFNPTYYGLNTKYRVKVSANPPEDPTDSDTSIIYSPPPAFMPPEVSSEVETLIVTNRYRLNELYGEIETNKLLNRLADFAQRDDVKGQIILINEHFPEQDSEFDRWTNSKTPMDFTESIAYANTKAAEIQSILKQYSSDTLKYIVLVGDDYIVPFWRMRDNVGGEDDERYYYDKKLEGYNIEKNTTVGLALAGNYFLTDDWYAVANASIGRLIGTPSEMRKTIDVYIGNNGIIGVQNALVVGYDINVDLAKSVNNLLGGIGVVVNDDLIGDTWEGRKWDTDELQKRHLQRNPTFFPLQSLNVHASHLSVGTPLVGEDEECKPNANDCLLQTHVADNLTHLAGAIIYSPGCHMGLNFPTARHIPPNQQSDPNDFPQAYAQKQATLISNTGYGMGSNETIAYTELLMKLFTEEALKANNYVPVGLALRSAKQRYYDEKVSQQYESGLDEKIMQQVVLYGLPMYRMQKEQTMSDDDPFPSVATSKLTPPSTLGGDSFVSQTLDITVTQKTGAINLTAIDGYQSITTTLGTYISLDSHTSHEEHTPIQPLYYQALGESPKVPMRSVVFRGGVYTETHVADPVIDVPVKLALGEKRTVEEPPFESTGFYPPVTFSLQHTANGGATLAAVMGQYDSTSKMQRIFKKVTFDVLYSASDDTIPPVVEMVEGYYDVPRHTAFFKVLARDLFVDESECNGSVENTCKGNVESVMLCYNSNLAMGCVDFVQDQDNPSIWKKEISVEEISDLGPLTTYWVQVVDKVGNQTNESPSGGPFYLTEKDPYHKIYLPSVKR